MIFHSYVNVYQRVSDWKKRHITSPKFVVDPQPIQLNWIYINPSLTTRCSMEVINMEAWFLKPQFRNWWNLDIDKNYEGLLIRSFSRDLDATWKAGKMNIRAKTPRSLRLNICKQASHFFSPKAGHRRMLWKMCCNLHEVAECWQARLSEHCNMQQYVIWKLDNDIVLAQVTSTSWSSKA